MVVGFVHGLGFVLLLVLSWLCGLDGLDGFGCLGCPSPLSSGLDHLDLPGRAEGGAWLLGGWLTLWVIGVRADD